MKKALILLFLIGIGASCSHVSDELKTDENRQLRKVENPKYQVICEDEDFIAYINKDIRMLENLVDPVKAQSIIGDGSKELSEQQASDFAHQFGFQSFEALNIHFIHQQGKLLKLNQKYGIFTFSPEELERLGLEGNVMYLPELDLVDETNKDCKARLSNCRIGAGALYFGGAAACLAGGAIVTDWWFGRFGSACRYLYRLCLFG